MQAALAEGRYNVQIVLGALALATIFAFWGAFMEFHARWSTEEELSYAYFVPVISGWILWERKDALLKSVGGPAPWAFVVAVGALLFTLAGAATHVALAEQIGFVVLMLTLPLILGGWALWKLSVIPLAFLFFIIPPPKMLITMMTQELQIMSSDLGVMMIRMFNIPVFNSGVIIELASGAKLEVEAACAGLNYMFPFVCLGALAAYFYNGPNWQRAIIIAMTVPITIVMNSVRIAYIGVMTEMFPEGNHTEGLNHDMQGFVVFLICLLTLMGVIWVMTLLRGKKDPLAFMGVEDVDPIEPKTPWTERGFMKVGIAATLLVLSFGVLNNTVGKRELIIPERLTFDTLPLEFPEWKSRITPLSDRVLNVLGADDYIITDMVGPEDQFINLYIAYLEARREGKSWHSPLQCLPGGGWEVALREPFSSKTYDGKDINLNRMIIKQKDTELLVHFWYDHRGRKIANEFSMRAMVVIDDLTRNRSDGAMVRLMTPVKPDETREDAEQRLLEMRHMLEPKLPKYVPV